MTFLPKHHHTKTRAIVLQFTSYAEKDIVTSVDLALRSFTAISRWYLHRNTSCSKTNAFAFWNLAKGLANHFEMYKYSSTQRITVIRSAFVYKKTREQFGFRKHSYSFYFKCSELQQKLLYPWLCQLKIPAEFTVRLK